MKTANNLRLALGFCLLLSPIAWGSEARSNERAGPAGARLVRLYNYEQCIRLENGESHVTLCPQVGGRVLEYSWKGENALYVDPREREYQPGQPRPPSSAGRFDIGPEKIIPRHPLLWSGAWTAKITGPRQARLTSQVDKATGVQLVREFQLAEKGSRLTCRQIIKNVSKQEQSWCHWSRTFAVGNGICLIPLTTPSRFPKSYVMYGPGDVIQFQPEDPQIRKRDGFLEILAAPAQPKLGMDSYAGWFAYLMPNNLMFVKTYPTYRDRVYNEMAGLTLSIWYPNRPMCELEPIGPQERLAPGATSSFTETWYLLPFAFPKDKKADLPAVRKLVESNCLR